MSSFSKVRLCACMISSSVSRCFDQSCGFRVSGYLTWQHWYRPLVFGFSWENTNRNNCSLQLRVRAFTMQGFQILTRRSLFRADMLFFLESKCITSIVQKTGIIHLFEFKHSTSTSQTDKESYFVFLNVEAVQFLVTKNVAVNPASLWTPLLRFTRELQTAETPHKTAVSLFFFFFFFLCNLLFSVKQAIISIITQDSITWIN